MVDVFVENKTHALFFSLSTFIHTSKLEMNSSRHPIVDKKNKITYQSRHNNFYQTQRRLKRGLGENTNLNSHVFHIIFFLRWIIRIL